MRAEVILAAVYAGALIVGAFMLEWLSAHTHARSLRYRTYGFDYNDQHDHWVCPEGQHLLPHEFDHERRLVRYRAKAHVCNGCTAKAKCTDSDLGREIVRPLDAWPHSEAGRFHRVLSVMMIVLALMILVIEGIRHHAADESALLLALIVTALAAGRWLVRDLRVHPAHFPVAAPSHGLRMTTTAADGSRPEGRWASRKQMEV